MEKKKIQPKSKLNAEQQEALLQALQQNTADAVNTQQNTANAVNIQQSTADAVNTQQSTANAVSGKTQRITVDLPIEIYDRMKTALDDNGQSMKGFLVGLIKSHFLNK